MVWHLVVLFFAHIELLHSVCGQTWRPTHELASLRRSEPVRHTDDDVEMVSGRLASAPTGSTSSVQNKEKDGSKLKMKYSRLRGSDDDRVQLVSAMERDPDSGSRRSGAPYRANASPNPSRPILAQPSPRPPGKAPPRNLFDDV